MDRFTDLDPNGWAYPSIEYCVRHGLMSGMSDTIFSPNTVTTRAQLVQVLYHLAGDPDMTGVTTPFTDLTSDWYQAAVAWAYETGVVDGTSPTTFSPSRPVTREQAAVLLMRYAARLPGFAGSAVLDADGLNAAADLLQAGKLPHPQGDLILTPHPGEMARLTGCSAADINADREGTALRFAKAWDAVVVLKGARTVIAAPDGRCAVNPTGNPGLARGGSGDVLAGMTSALLACKLPAFEAAVCAVYLHGAAADCAAAKHGEAGMLPHDLFAELGGLFAANGR